MLNPSRYLGVDVSKDTLVVAFERQRWQFSNSKEGFRQLLAQIKKQSGDLHVVCEATGSYHLPMCLALQEAGIAVSICNPARIRFFGRSEGVLAKNDPLDAALIEREVHDSGHRACDQQQHHDPARTNTACETPGWIERRHPVP